MKQLIIRIIDIAVKLWRRIRDACLQGKDFIYRKITVAPQVASVEETIDEIVKNNCSIARFGDGEIKLTAGKSISFQDSSDFITKKMREVLSSDVDGLLIGIADFFGDGKRYDDETNAYWKKHLARYRGVWYRYLIKGKKYYNASMTRQYIALKNKGESGELFEKIRSIWDGRDVVIIEGEKSRFGVGNDLLENTKSVKRILGPSYQAFSKYNEILKEAKKADKSSLILLAIGPAATCLAYDLHMAGYQAVDIGHVDIEYEWYRMGAKEKMPVKNKMMHEAVVNDFGEFSDSLYESQIIAKVL